MKAKHVLPLFALLLLLSSTSCRKIEVWHDVPECIWDKIDEYEEALGSCHFQVDWYEFNGRDVYVFKLPEGDCYADSPSEVIDGTCVRIGTIGGYYPSYTLEGLNFNTDATFQGTIHYH